MFPPLWNSSPIHDLPRQHCSWNGKGQSCAFISMNLRSDSEFFIYFLQNLHKTVITASFVTLQNFSEVIALNTGLCTQNQASKVGQNCQVSFEEKYHTPSQLFHQLKKHWLETPCQLVRALKKLLCSQRYKKNALSTKKGIFILPNYSPEQKIIGTGRKWCSNGAGMHR